MANLGNVSVLNINGNELTIKDAALTEIVEEIIEAIGANNDNIAERINNLHDRSFDAEIKISSVNETEISNIVDGLYKVQYVTITGEGTEATETLNNSAILIQKGTNQYLIKDGQILSRTKTNDTWGTWASAISLVLSSEYEMSSASNRDLALEGGDTYEEAFGKLEKTIYDNEYVISSALNDLNEKVEDIPTYNATNKLSADYIEDGTTNKVINVQADWNQTTTTADDYIKNKPTIKDELSDEYEMSSDSNNDLALEPGDTYEEAFGKIEKVIEDNEYVISSALTDLNERMNNQHSELSDEYEMSSDSNEDLFLEAGDSYEEAFSKLEKNIIDNEYAISISLNDLHDRIEGIPIYDTTNKLSADFIEDGTTNKVINVKPDWNATSGSAAEILNKPDLSNFLTIETQSNWNETNTSSAAYIQNKPTIPAAQIQADWNQTTTTELDYIKNKPNITVISNPNGDTNISSNGTLNIRPSFAPGDINIETNFDAGNINITGGNKLNLSSGDDDININTTNDINLTTSSNGKVYYNNKEVATKNDIPTIPTTSTTVTQNDTNPVSGGAVYNKIADLIGTAPAALDTLGEIATALNNDADLAATLTNQITSKVPKVSNPTTDNFASFNSDGTIKDSSYSASSFITSIKTVNNESLVGTGNIVVSGLPQVSASDNGKILMVVNGQWQLVSPSVLYSGSGVPNNANGNNGDLFIQTE